MHSKSLRAGLPRPAYALAALREAFRDPCGRISAPFHTQLASETIAVIDMDSQCVSDCFPLRACTLALKRYSLGQVKTVACETRRALYASKVRNHYLHRRKGVIPWVK